MFNKKIKLFLITLVFMLSISCVSATDSNSTDDMIISDVDDEPPSGDIINTSSNGTLNETQDNYSLEGNDVEMYYNNGSTYTVTLFKDNISLANVSVNITLNGVTFNETTDDNGSILIPLNLKVGKYIITSTYNNNTTLKNTINVLPIIISSNLVKTYKSNTKFYATFLNSTGGVLVNTSVKFKIKGKTSTKKTNSKGIASIDLNYNVGTYTIYIYHPYGFNLTNKIQVKNSIQVSNLEKHYRSSKKLKAVFYGKKGEVLKNKKVTVKCNGKKYILKTDKNGVIKLQILLKPGSYKVTLINPVTGEKVVKSIRVFNTLSAKKSMNVYTGKNSVYEVKLYKNEKLVKNAKVYIYIKWHKNTVKTDKNGVASIKFNLARGTYIFISKDPYTGATLKSKIIVKYATIKANNIFAKENTTGEFKVSLYTKYGTIAKKTKLLLIVDGKTHYVKTNARGVATYKFKMPVGIYKVVCKDLKTGYTLNKNIVVLKVGESKAYNKYGISEDGKTIMAIGRPSASGEIAKYGYNFYQTEFLRICSYCGSNQLYWGIFWAKSETADYGVFPATGLREGGSAEGHIFCAHCDSDWSIFGRNHGTGGDLTVVCSPIKVTKETAYLLKSGTYVYP